MALISLDEAKTYLRVDSADEETLIGSLLSSAEVICRDVARLTDEEWADVDSEKSRSDRFTASELAGTRAAIKVAVFFTLGYLYEHREDADHHDLMLTLRSLLFSIREGRG